MHSFRIRFLNNKFEGQPGILIYLLYIYKYEYINIRSSTPYLTRQLFTLVSYDMLRALQSISVNGEKITFNQVTS